VYEGAPTSVTAFFAIVPKIAILGMFLRLLLFSFYDLFFSWQSLLVFCSVCSLLIGAFGAMAQKKIKRLLVYSSIGHVGYLLIGLCCGTVESLQAVLLYLVVYTLMTLNMFAAILSCTEHTGVHRIKYIQDLGLLAQTNPVLACTMSCTLFSMAGIPPLAGFMSKFYLFSAAMSSSLYALAVIGVLSSVLSCFYYIRLIKIMYFEQPSHYVTYQPIDREKATLLGLTTFFIVFFVVFPKSLFLWTGKIALLFLD
jgi:proton-translocating NADH-quinone oxidoreductase chain N